MDPEVPLEGEAVAEVVSVTVTCPFGPVGGGEVGGEETEDSVDKLFEYQHPGTNDD